MFETSQKSENGATAIDMRKEIASHPLVVGMGKASLLASVVGKNGTANVLALALDEFLTTSEVTSRKTYSNPATPVLMSMLPDSLRDAFCSIMHWGDMAVATGVIPESELEALASDPEKLESLAARLNSGVNQVLTSSKKK